MLQQETEPKNFQWAAKRILKSQKKLGALKGLKATTLTLSESRKRNLKQAGLYSVATISAAAITAAGITLAHKRGKKTKNGRKDVTPTAKRKFPKLSKGKIAAATTSGLVTSAGIGAGILARSKKQTLLIEAKYAYGTKLFEVCSLSQEELANKVDKKILREVTAEVASLKTAKEWAVKESASSEYLKLAVLGESLIEDVLESQLLEAVDVTVAATDAARNVSDFEDIEDDYEEEVEEGFLFEDEDFEEVEEGFLFEDAECSDDEEVIFETDMFKI